MVTRWILHSFYEKGSIGVEGQAESKSVSARNGRVFAGAMNRVRITFRKRHEIKPEGWVCQRDDNQCWTQELWKRRIHGVYGCSAGCGGFNQLLKKSASCRKTSGARRILEDWRGEKFAHRMRQLMRRWRGWAKIVDRKLDAKFRDRKSVV